MKFRNNHARGYTIVEIVMSMAVLAIGLSGLIAMQRVTVASNRHAKNLATATHIAQSWLTMMEAEASAWAAPTATMPADDWHTTGNGAGWFRPTYNAARQFGPGFDALGNPVTDATVDTRYCVDLRVVSMITPGAALSGLSRVEVRVAWTQENPIGGNAPVDVCDLTATQLSTAAFIADMHFVHMSTAVRTVDRLDAKGCNNATNVCDG